MTRRELMLSIYGFLSKKKWRMEHSVCDHICKVSPNISYEDAEFMLARLVETKQGIEWFLPARIDENEDLRASTELRYRLTKEARELYENRRRRLAKVRLPERPYRLEARSTCRTT